MGKERGARKVRAFSTIVKFHVMVVHFVCVVAQEQTQPKRCFSWALLACPNVANSRRFNTFGGNGEMTIQQNKLYLREVVRKKEEK
jgi:hypothetical protein